MSRYWSPLVHALTPYVPGEQPKLANLVKLNTNENPYGPSPKVLDAIRTAVDDGLRLYPDPSSEQLRRIIAGYYAVEPEQVFVGNGSDEVLAHAFLGLFKHERPLLFPDITYSFYPVYCDLYQIAYQQIPLDDSFALRVDDYRRPNGGIVFPNPNAPTGRLLPLEALQRLMDANPDSVVVVDEAYIDFGGHTAVGLVARYPNLLVIQTLSKSRSLAGLRVGFAVGQAPLVEALDRIKNSFNSYPLDRLAMAGAIAALQDRVHFERTRQAVIASRERLAEQLNGLGFQVVPSAANFLFARHPRQDAGELAAGLRTQGIIVRHFKKPRIDQYLRITVGTDAQCQILVEALERLV